MEKDVELALSGMGSEIKAQGEAIVAQGTVLTSIDNKLDTVKESMHGQSMALMQEAGKRELLEATLKPKVAAAHQAADDADKNADLAHDRVTGIKKVGWAIVMLIVAQSIGFVFWLVRNAMTAVVGG